MADESLFRRALGGPWRVRNEVRRVLAWPYIRSAFALHGIEWGRGWKVFGMPIIQRYRGSTVVLGDGLTLRSWLRTNPLVPNHPVVLATRTAEASLQIGQGCGLTGATLVAAGRIEIGDRVFVGANATIADTDFHPIHPDRRRQAPQEGQHAPVIIGDDVFIGMNSLVLKGVTLSEGAVVGAGSVVTQDVPARTIVAGNPARPIRKIS